MTHPALNAFLDRLSEDEDLYDRVEKAVRGQADTAAATVEFAGSIGFDFSRCRPSRSAMACG